MIPFGGLLSLLTPTKILLAGFIALALYCSHLRNVVTGLELKASQVSEQRAKDAFVASEKNQETTNDLSNYRDGQQQAIAVVASSRAAVASSFSADSQRLRLQLSEYARGNRVANDSLTSCLTRADALGQLLEDGVRLQVRLATEAESNADSTRSLSAWTGKVKSALNH